ncbi:hypothetical protein Glove_213g123 [Diversispora epigaea]|uniref:Uncharacterized protein n=1 Tax=Diversispora epigaea TaxID=1348612 RepID=A0A397IR59_9GLOM|nr:hypothetical protein Glove_213g123 [Diversispora epigaea]
MSNSLVNTSRIEPTGKRNPKPLGSFGDPETRNPKITDNLVKTGVVIRETVITSKNPEGMGILKE